MLSIHAWVLALPMPFHRIATEAQSLTANTTAAVATTETEKPHANPIDEPHS